MIYYLNYNYKYLHIKIRENCKTSALFNILKRKTYKINYLKEMVL